MKFTIDKNILLENLNNVIRGISTKNVIPVLNGIKFELKEEGLTLTASDSELTIESFIESKFKNLEIIGVKFNKSEFLKTSLKGVDFSSSDITDVMFDLMSVKGMIVNQFQCVELANLIGVQVK